MKARSSFTKSTILSLLFSIPLAGMAQADWELKKDEEGIRVFVKDLEGIEFRAFKGEAELDYSAQEVVMLLQRVDQYPDLFPSTAEARVIKHLNDTSYIHYSYIDSPWPVSDRDGAYRTTISQKGSYVEFKLESLPEYVERVEDVVRIQETSAYWKIRTLGERKVHLVYEVYSNPGGSLPAWLVNSAAVSQPFETIQNLHALLAR
jgi:hypothetical protein